MKNYYLFVFLLLLHTACKEQIVTQSIVKENQKNIVKMERLVLTSDAIPIQSSGILRAKLELNLSFKLGGILNKVHAKESQYVHKGQVLAEVSSPEINALVRKAQQGYEKAERDLERIKKMYADTVATIENLQDFTTQLEVAKSDYQLAVLNQGHTQIVAPVNGRIIKQYMQNNELVGPGMPVFRLASDDKNGFLIKIGVADKDIVKVKINDKAKVIFDAYPGTIFEAHVSEIPEAADPMTGAFPLSLTIHNQVGKPLKKGFIGKVKLFPSNHDPYYKINTNALVEGHKNYAIIYVSVKVGEKIRAKRTKVYPDYIGESFFTLSKEQLSGVDRIVTDGAAYLSDGMEIQEIENKIEGISYRE